MKFFFIITIIIFSAGITIGQTDDFYTLENILTRTKKQLKERLYIVTYNPALPCNLRYLGTFTPPDYKMHMDYFKNDTINDFSYGFESNKSFYDFKTSSFTFNKAMILHRRNIGEHIINLLKDSLTLEEKVNETDKLLNQEKYRKALFKTSCGNSKGILYKAYENHIKENNIKIRDISLQDFYHHRNSLIDSLFFSFKEERKQDFIKNDEKYRIYTYAPLIGRFYIKEGIPILLNFHKKYKGQDEIIENILINQLARLQVEPFYSQRIKELSNAPFLYFHDKNHGEINTLGLSATPTMSLLYYLNTKECISILEKYYSTKTLPSIDYNSILGLRHDSHSHHEDISCYNEDTFDLRAYSLAFTGGYIPLSEVEGYSSFMKNHVNNPDFKGSFFISYHIFLGEGFPIFIKHYNIEPLNCPYMDCLHILKQSNVNSFCEAYSTFIKNNKEEILKRMYEISGTPPKEFQK